MVVFGGRGERGGEHANVNETHVLDFVTMTWSTVASVPGVCPPPRCYHSAWVNRDNHMIVFGGGTYIHILDLPITHPLDLHPFDLPLTQPPY